MLVLSDQELGLLGTGSVWGGRSQGCDGGERPWIDEMSDSLQTACTVRAVARAPTKSYRILSTASVDQGIVRIDRCNQVRVSVRGSVSPNGSAKPGLSVEIFVGAWEGIGAGLGMKWSVALLNAVSAC
eukprot:5212267-Alexandrium_andersonii.AAC.1